MESDSKVDPSKPDSDLANENTRKGTKNLKYPFNGQATNLIDKFLIFSYDQKTKEYTVKKHLDYSIRDTLETRYGSCTFQERPNIINEINNDYHKDLLDNDLISELLFPNNPIMYFLPKEDVNLEKKKK